MRMQQVANFSQYKIKLDDSHVSEYDSGADG